MKFIFSLLLISNVYARDLITIHHSAEQAKDAMFVAQTLQHQLALPESFIQLETTPCQISEFNVATVCILENGEVEVKQVKVEVMQRMLKAFGEVYETP